MVLQDEHGDKIHASVKKTLIYRFEQLLKEDKIYQMYYFVIAESTGLYRTIKHKYRLHFDYDTEVRLLHNTEILPSTLTFTFLADILENKCNTDYLVDVIGILTGVGYKRDILKNVKDFIASGDHNTIVMAIQYAKINTFKGKLGLQNVKGAIKIIFNCEFSESAEFKARTLCVWFWLLSKILQEDLVGGIMLASVIK
ncbi:uncharacterized protein LOC113870324 [Abrus precatorius]|uniref:Uncharacterized protein LOC113870324 n=1 Tax=Abrus precatorius TaxID=3816 RepID=A0A8B8M2F5_ABRPR|nr:uncharacterized protein LOC113870324 [Abrus precatorius]